MDPVRFEAHELVSPSATQQIIQFSYVCVYMTLIGTSEALELVADHLIDLSCKKPAFLFVVLVVQDHWKST